MSDERILVVEDDGDMRLLLEEELGAAGYEVLVAGEGGEALTLLQSHSVDLVLTDLAMPGIPGEKLLQQVRAWDSSVPVIIMTAFGSIESAVEAMRGGARHYITKPFRLEDMLGTVKAALEERRVRWPAPAGASSDADEAPEFVLASESMRRVYERVLRAAAVDTPVLIRGESGTGKEWLARSVHRSSPRASRAFLPVNSSAIPDTLLESLLFGHRRGAFTDAREDRTGLLLQAEGGTLFLDEVGDMSLGLQAKLLRMLQEHEIHPLGAPAPIPVDVRVVAATHRDLAAMCRDGRFREDLFYRLDVVPIEVPPLRDRLEDIPPLVQHFLARHGRRLGREQVSVSHEALERMRAHTWPGNVRELENVVQRALVLGSGPVIGPEDLPESLGAARLPGASDEVRSLSDVEREQVTRAMQAARGNKSAAARLLGLDRKTLYRKLELYGIRSET